MIYRYMEFSLSQWIVCFVCHARTRILCVCIWLYHLCVDEAIYQLDMHGSQLLSRSICGMQLMELGKWVLKSVVSFSVWKIVEKQILAIDVPRCLHSMINFSNSQEIEWEKLRINKYSIYGWPTQTQTYIIANSGNLCEMKMVVHRVWYVFKQFIRESYEIQ